LKTYLFPPFQLDLARYELKRGGRSLALPRIAMEMLILLVERQGSLVSRQEIATKLWPDSDPADRVDSINTAINRIRTTLGDEPAKPRYIQTVIGKGYRFAAEVQVELLPEVNPLPAQPVAMPESSQRLEATSQETLPASQPQRWTASRRLWALAAAATLIVLLATVFLYRSRHATGPDSISMARLTSNLSENSISAAAISADGRLLAYADADGIQHQEIGDVRLRRLLNPKLVEVDQLAWSADQRWLLLGGIGTASRQPEIWRLPVDGSPATLLKSDARAAAFSPDGSRIAYTPTDGTGIWICDMNGQNAHAVLLGKAGETFSAVLWTLDGRSLIAERHTAVAEPFQPSSPTRGYAAAYIVADAATGTLRTAIQGVRYNHALLTAPNRLLFTRAEAHDDADSSSLWAVSIDPTTGAFLNAPQQLQSWPERRVLALDRARDAGTVIAVLRQGRFGVYVGDFDRAGPRLENVRRLSQDDGIAYSHGWTPDSRKVLYELSRAGGPYHIYSQSLKLHDPDLLVTQAGQQVFPGLSPDHHWIIYASRATDTAPYFLFRLPLEGGQPAPINTVGPQSDFRCPDTGSYCVLRVTDDHRRFVFYALDPVRGQGAVLYTMPWMPNGPPQWSISPDASQLALTMPEASTPQVAVVNMKSGHTAILPVDIDSKITAVHWSSDGQGIFVSSKTPFRGELSYVNLSGHATLLRRMHGTTYAVPSPDGRMVSFIDQNVDSNVWQIHFAH
jgi:DNA-binding winged helix-turn-helix (wHTH) protein/Tol biopolymer transport system component